MPINRIVINGYRGFKQPGTLDFAVPDGTSGSGLTIITGPNNSGKSTILEALNARGANDQSVSFTAGSRNSIADFVEIIYMVNGNKSELLRSNNKGSSEATKSPLPFDRNFSVYFLPSRRAFRAYFDKSDWTRESFLGNGRFTSQRSTQLSGFEYRLFNSLNKQVEFNNLLEHALGFRPEWTIDLGEQNQYFLKYFNREHSHSSDGLGEGIVSIFAIVDALYDSNEGDVIVIDEPELSLHPSLQKRVADILNEYSKTRQIIISTHSPYFIDLQSLANGAQLARVISTENGTEINQLSKESITAIAEVSTGNLRNPHTFGLEAREIFFQEENIIIAEGQEDVVGYRLIANQLDIPIPGHFFGWGVGGAGNVQRVCRILSDLGFQKVAILLDGDQVNQIEQLNKDFPNYLAMCIPAHDIRDKPEVKPRDAVVGLSDSNFRIKAEHADGMSEIFKTIQAHMSK